MKFNMFRSILPLLSASLLSTGFCAAEGGGDAASDGVRFLKFEDARKQEVNMTQIGFTSTRIFYTFEAAKAVLVIHIGNRTADFRSTGTLTIFAPDTDAEAIAKWVNNQHSCGLFVDPAKPTTVHQLPEGIASVIRREHGGQQVNPGDQTPYSQYKVRIAVKESQVEGQFRLQAFEDDAHVYLKVESL